MQDTQQSTTAHTRCNMTPTLLDAPSSYGWVCKILTNTFTGIRFSALPFALVLLACSCLLGPVEGPGDVSVVVGEEARLGKIGLGDSQRELPVPPPTVRPTMPAA